MYELVQNAADQLAEKGGRIEVVLTDEHLYCANDGEPFSTEGLSSILHAYLSERAMNRSAASGSASSRSSGSPTRRSS